MENDNEESYNFKNILIIMDILFWILFFIVFYTYIGYGLLLYVLVKVKELFVKRAKESTIIDLPLVTLLIPAYNEENVVVQKMNNCLSLTYPLDKLKIVWVTDGSTDKTNEILKNYDNVSVFFEPIRGGKAAAINRAMKFINTPIVVYTDANTMLSYEAITEIIREFADPNVGCVAGEKRVARHEKQDAAATEGMYWTYESFLKALDYRLYSTVGAAGELFAIRTNIYVLLPSDTLLDDFVLSLTIAKKGYKIAYCKKAYAIEEASANIKEEAKRKVRIAAGGLQAIWRLRDLLNIFRYGVFSFQYISHRVLRWTITPIALFMMLPINIYIVFNYDGIIYIIVLIMQILMYVMGLWGYLLSVEKIRNKLIFVPYYFLFMNLNVIRGVFYLYRYKGDGVWDKAIRSHKTV